MNIRNQRNTLGRLALALVGWCLIALPSLGQITGVGSVNSISVQSEPGNGNRKVLFGLSTGGALEVSVYATDLIRVRFHWDGIWSKEDIAIAKPLGAWDSITPTLQDDGNIYRILTPDVEVEVVKSPNVQVHFKSRQGFYLSRDSRMEYNTQYDPISDPSYINIRYTHALPNGFKLKAIREMPAGEAYFGFGEYAGPANRRGRNIQGWNSDTFSWQEGWSPMYMTMPFFYGSQAAAPGRPAYTYGLFFNNPARPVFRMGTQWGDRYSFEAADGQVDYFFFAGGNDHQMRKVLNRYTELTGGPTMLPKWAFGYHMSRWSYSNQGWVQWLAQEFRNRDIPLDAIYLDLDYFDTTPDDNYLDNSLRQLTFNHNFPNPVGMIQNVAQRGVKLVPIIEAWLTPTDPKHTEAWGLFHFLKDYNYNQVSTPIYFGNVSWLDFSSTPARNWWKGKLVNFLNQYPLAGMWNDLNEPADIGDNPYTGIPLNGQYWLDGRYTNQWDSRKFHLNEKNLYCIREVQVTYDALLEKYPGQRPFVLSRAGYPGIQRYALGWSGDNVASWDHCRHNIGLGVSVMMSGQVNFGHDVGGFVNSTTGELITRWHEWSAFNPFFRNHSTKWDAEREPWRFGDYFGGLMRNIIKLRYQFMPYLYTLAYQSTVDGVPMNTPTVMHFQHDPGTHWLNDNDFMVGDYLLVSPIFNPGQTWRTTYLPAGSDWYNWYTGSKHTGGGNASQNAPLGQIPLYARAGAIIPMGPPMAFANQFVPDFLDLHVFPNPPGFSSEFTLHEDDGETFNFLAGAYARTRFVSSRTESNFTFVINAREGAFNTGNRHYYVKIRDLDGPTAVTINGVAVPLDASHAANQCYSYDGVARMLVVKVPDTRALTTIQVSYIPNYTPLTWVGNINNVPTNGAIQSTDNLWVNAYSFPQGAGVGGELIYSTNSGATWITNTLNKQGVSGQNDHWNRNLGSFATGTPIWYWVRVRDAQHVTITNNNGGAFYRVTVGVLGPELVWIGSSHNWPLEGSIKPTDNLWVNTYTWPRNAAQLTQVVISTNEGVTWTTNAMVKAGVSGNDDWWHLNLGAFANGTKLWYWMRGTDGYGTTKIDRNNNQFYRVTIGTPAIALVWAGNSEQFPTTGNIKPTDAIWLNCESWPKQAGVMAQAIISTNSGATWVTNTMTLAGTRSNGANDWWNINLGAYTNNTKVWYWMRVVDGNGGVREVRNNGSHFQTQVGVPGPAIVWAGNIDQFPANGQINASSDLWLNVESWPKQAGIQATIHYRVNGGAWTTTTMNLAGTRSNGANDWWNRNMGKFSSGAQVEYYFEVMDSNGTIRRAPETGTRTASVN
ncbi:MAG TPA: glycoside hydrolase family 31 protein [Kiritimatiellia bacterium]|nr:glycoside hydrolase family 31 protein [Kiritimatiellia bacterium]HMO98959.1 glycoside hydrolase family 31 protein [Kiritimatiellia bacterium]HMP96417.1 glycoside hydrolase family 31 protein [Kiritimatiellia bacterium]